MSLYPNLLDSDPSSRALIPYQPTPTWSELVSSNLYWLSQRTYDAAASTLSAVSHGVTNTYHYLSSTAPVSETDTQRAHFYKAMQEFNRKINVARQQKADLWENHQAAKENVRQSIHNVMVKNQEAMKYLTNIAHALIEFKKTTYSQLPLENILQTPPPFQHDYMIQLSPVLATAEKLKKDVDDFIKGHIKPQAASSSASIGYTSKLDTTNMLLEELGEMTKKLFITKIALINERIHELNFDGLSSEQQAFALNNAFTKRKELEESLLEAIAFVKESVQQFVPDEPGKGDVKSILYFATLPEEKGVLLELEEKYQHAAQETNKARETLVRLVAEQTMAHEEYQTQSWYLESLLREREDLKEACETWEDEQQRMIRATPPPATASVDSYAKEFF